MSFTTTLCWEDDSHNLFLDLQAEFKKLNAQKKSVFVTRNGFNPSGYKNFAESALNVCLIVGLETGDLKWDNGRIVIDLENLKGGLFRKKVIGLPIDWRIR